MTGKNLRCLRALLTGVCLAFAGALACAEDVGDPVDDVAEGEAVSPKASATPDGPEVIEATGTVYVTRNGERILSAFVMTSDEYRHYDILLDENGKAVANEFADQEISFTAELRHSGRGETRKTELVFSNFAKTPVDADAEAAKEAAWQARMQMLQEKKQAYLDKKEAEKQAMLEAAAKAAAEKEAAEAERRERLDAGVSPEESEAALEDGADAGVTEVPEGDSSVEPIAPERLAEEGMTVPLAPEDMPQE